MDGEAPLIRADEQVHIYRLGEAPWRISRARQKELCEGIEGVVLLCGGLWGIDYQPFAGGEQVAKAVKLSVTFTNSLAGLLECPPTRVHQPDVHQTAIRTNGAKTIQPNAVNVQV